MFTFFELESFVFQAGLVILDLPGSFFQLLESQTCATIPGFLGLKDPELCVRIDSYFYTNVLTNKMPYVTISLLSLSQKQNKTKQNKTKQNKTKPEVGPRLKDV